MSNTFSKKFEKFVGEVGSDLNLVGSDDQPRSRVQKSMMSSAAILAGDVLFFNYRSERFGVGEHMGMVIGNHRSLNGIYNFTSQKKVSKKYVSAVKLNNIWHETASILIEAYRETQLKYTSVDQDEEKGLKVREEKKADSTEGTKTEDDEDKEVKKSKEDKTRESFMTIVGRENYRTYIINNMWNTYEFSFRKEDVT